MRQYQGHKLLQTEIELRDRKREIEALRATGDKRQVTKSVTAYNNLYRKHTLNIALQLCSSTKPFKTLWIKAQSLIANPELTFSVYRAGFIMGASYTRELTGSIHQNGHLYLQRSAMSSPWNDSSLSASETLRMGLFGLKYYPTAMVGQINPLGQLTLRADAVSHEFFGSRVPVKFVGSINEDGEVDVELVHSEWEWNGGEYMEKLIAAPFHNRPKAQAAYFETTHKINKQIATYRQELIRQAPNC